MQLLQRTLVERTFASRSLTSFCTSRETLDSVTTMRPCRVRARERAHGDEVQEHEDPVAADERLEEIGRQLADEEQRRDEEQELPEDAAQRQDRPSQRGHFAFAQELARASREVRPAENGSHRKARGWRRRRDGKPLDASISPISDADFRAMTGAAIPCGLSTSA